MRLEFFMPMCPPTITAQERQIGVRGGKPFFYDPPELKAAKAKLRDHLAAHVPAEPFTGAVQLVTKWCWPCGDEHRDGEWKITKPDTDNLVKAPKDLMEKLGFFTNDALVASEVIEKFWARVPGIYVCITDLVDNERGAHEL
jgi:Holliday junction resolvase RusA-like endonuclease